MRATCHQSFFFLWIDMFFSPLAPLKIWDLASSLGVRHGMVILISIIVLSAKCAWTLIKLDLLKTIRSFLNGIFLEALGEPNHSCWNRSCLTGLILVLTWFDLSRKTKLLQSCAIYFHNSNNLFKLGETWKLGETTVPWFFQHGRFSGGVHISQ